MLKQIILLFIILAITACSHYPKNVEQALTLAGDNRAELEWVLEHYSLPEDSLKYRAACFLIANMPGYYTTTSLQIETFDSAFCKSLSLMKKLDYQYHDPYINGKIIRTRIERLWNELTGQYGDPASFSIQKTFDLQVITSDFLIAHIDQAFQTRDFPWAKHLSFDQFCEYVLPYRFADEPLEYWRPYFMERYRWVTDSAQDKTDPVEICRLINDDIASWFIFDGMFNSYPRAFSSSLLLKTQVGSCLGQAGIAAFAMRSMGLAIAHNAVPQWGNRSMGHDFSSVIAKDGTFVDFLGGELPPGKNEIRDKAPKIYRKTYSIRPVSAREKGNIQKLKINPTKHIDVTCQYIPVSTVTLDVPNVPKDINVVYLCTFDNQNWIPLVYNPVKKGKCTFEDLGRDIVYLPVYYRGREYTPAGPPFILSVDGTMKPLHPGGQEVQEAMLYRKFHPSQRMIDFSKQMIGGKFQAANKPDFSDAVDLYAITSTPESYLKHYPVVSKDVYRYIRYVFPPVVPGETEGQVAEICFKGTAGADLHGDYIGSPGVAASQFNILFDRKLDDYVTINIADTIVEDYPGRVITIPHITTVWAGLDLKNRYHITSVGYCPRNDTNNVYERCQYELYYWDDRWISLGAKQPENDCLVYDNLPVGALFLLRNHTEGKEERIFTYENGKQAWW